METAAVVAEPNIDDDDISNVFEENKFLKKIKILRLLGKCITKCRRMKRKMKKRKQKQEKLNEEGEEDEEQTDWWTKYFNSLDPLVITKQQNVARI